MPIFLSIDVLPAFTVSQAGRASFDRTRVPHCCPVPRPLRSAPAPAPSPPPISAPAPATVPANCNAVRTQSITIYTPFRAALCCAEVTLCHMSACV